MTVGGGTLEWTVAADEACRSWVTVVRKEGTAVVTVADNPATEPRSGSVVISADVAGVGPKAVKVVQEGRVLQPRSVWMYVNCISAAGRKCWDRR